MDDPTKPDARRTNRAPRGLIGMLVLVAIVELTIAGRRLDFTTIWADDWRSSAESAARRSKGRDILCFGDSLIKFAVLPKQIEAKTGLKSYNLAVNAGTMPSAYFLLRQSIDSGARPKGIVADFCTLMMPEVPDRSIRLYPELASVGDCLDLARTARDPGFFTSSVLAKLLPSYKCRFEIRESIKAALDGRRASPWPRQSAIWASWKANQGAQPMPPSPIDPIPDATFADQLSPESWTCDPINAAYFEKFLALAASKEIPVFWLIPPMNPVIEARRVARKSDQAYTRFVRSAMVEHPEVTVVDARRSGYDLSVYVDGLHLDRVGAKLLSGDLAAIVDDRLRHPDRADRWVDLPAVNGRSGAVARTGIDSRTR